jgi:TrmH family RNA methyltransferase
VVSLEGLHAVKHAYRFGAALREVRVADRAAALELADRLAPDLRPVLETAKEVGHNAIRAAAGGRPVATGVLALAPRPPGGLADALEAPGPLVVLHDPRDLGNAGAAVRVAAAARAAGVLVAGALDPWHPVCVRGAAGLQFAQPVDRVDGLPPRPGRRPVIAVHPDGSTALGERRLPTDAAYVFGTERDGLPSEVVRAADLTLAIPMRPGVSSLNLATSVAAVLYGAGP